MTTLKNWMIIFAFSLCIFHSKSFSQGFGIEEKNFNRLKKNFDSLNSFPENYKYDTLRLTILDSFIESGFNKNRDSVYNLYKKIAYRANWPKGIARYKLYYGNSSVFDQAPVTAAKYLVEAEKELEKYHDYEKQIYALMRLSMLVTHGSDSLSAKEHIDKAIRIAKKINSRNWLIKTLNYKANTLVYRDRLDLAIPIFEEIGRFENLPESEKIVNDLNLGMCYINYHREKEGIKILNLVLKKVPNEPRYIGLKKGVRFDIINFYRDKKKDFKTAKYYFDQLTQQMQSTPIKLGEYKLYYQQGYQIEKGLGNTTKALYFLEKMNLYSDSLAIEDKKNGELGIKSQLELKTQTEKLQSAELAKLKSQNEKANQLRWFFLAASMIGLLSTIYVFRTNRKLKANNENLKTKNKEISEALLQGQTIERKRVAADLHDNLGSTLSALWLSVDAIDKSKMDEEEKEIHQNLRTNLEKAYNDVRLLSHNLLPEELDKQGLVQTLQGFVRQINKNSKMRFELKISEDFGRVANKIEFELYSICLELVNNIIKHSKATEAKIELSRTESQIKLLVSDNGIGTFKNDSDGKGMKNVRARIDSLNGEWKITENGGIINEIVVLT